MMWKVRLRGDNVDLRALVSMLGQGDPKVSLDAEGHYVVESSVFDPLAAALEVQAEAERLLTMINGAAKALDPSYRSVQLARQFENAQGLHAVIGDEVILVGGPTQTVVARGRAPDNSPPSPATAWLALARSNAEVARALLLLGSVELGWAALSKLVELVEHDVGGATTLLEEGWATRKQVSAFDAGAQGATSSTVVSRSTVVSGDRNDRAMTLIEGRHFVHGLIQSWLQWRTQHS